MAERIQRKRTKGWRMPEGAVYVGRPSRWGNPFWHVEDWHGRKLAVRLFANTARGIWCPIDIPSRWPDIYVGQVYDDHARWLERIGGHPIEVIRSELAGHDLACWCSPTDVCHADVLLEIANPKEAP